MGEGGSQRPGGPGRKRASVLQLELPCATLDEVRARHPELRTRRFLLRTEEPKPLDTVVRIDATLSDGTHCFSATSIVERVHPEPDRGMTLWLVAADDSGRELVAWMGGPPPPLLKGAPGAAPRAPETPRAAGPAQPGGGQTLIKEQPDDGSDLFDPFAAFEAAAAAVDRAMDESPAAPRPAAKRLGAVQLVTRAIPVTPLPPEPAPAELDPAPAPEPARADLDAEPAPEPAPVELDPPVQPEPTAAPPVAPAPPAHTRNRPPPSRRPAPPPLPRPTLTPGQPAQAVTPALPEVVEDVVPARPEAARKGPIIGIDLGTTNSCAAVVKDGKAFVIPSREGYNP